LQSVKSFHSAVPFGYGDAKITIFSELANFISIGKRGFITAAPDDSQNVLKIGISLRKRYIASAKLQKTIEKPPQIAVFL